MNDDVARLIAEIIFDAQTGDIDKVQKKLKELEEQSEKTGKKLTESQRSAVAEIQKVVNAEVQAIEKVKSLTQEFEKQNAVGADSTVVDRLQKELELANKQLKTLKDINKYKIANLEVDKKREKRRGSAPVTRPESKLSKREILEKAAELREATEVADWDRVLSPPGLGDKRIDMGSIIEDMEQLDEIVYAADREARERFEASKRGMADPTVVESQFEKARDKTLYQRHEAKWGSQYTRPDDDLYRSGFSFYDKTGRFTEEMYDAWWGDDYEKIRAESDELREKIVGASYGGHKVFTDPFTDTDWVPEEWTKEKASAAVGMKKGRLDWVQKNVPSGDKKKKAMDRLEYLIEYFSAVEQDLHTPGYLEEWLKKRKERKWIESAKKEKWAKQKAPSKEQLKSDRFGAIIRGEENWAEKAGYEHPIDFDKESLGSGLALAKLDDAARQYDELIEQYVGDINETIRGWDPSQMVYEPRPKPDMPGLVGKLDISKVVKGAYKKSKGSKKSEEESDVPRLDKDEAMAIIDQLARESYLKKLAVEEAKEAKTGGAVEHALEQGKWGQTVKVSKPDVKKVVEKVVEPVVEEVVEVVKEVADELSDDIWQQMADAAAETVSDEVEVEIPDVDDVPVEKEELVKKTRKLTPEEYGDIAGGYRKKKKEKVEVPKQVGQQKLFDDVEEEIAERVEQVADVVKTVQTELVDAIADNVVEVIESVAEEIDKVAEDVVNTDEIVEEVIKEVEEVAKKTYEHLHAPILTAEQMWKDTVGVSGETAHKRKLVKEKKAAEAAVKDVVPDVVEDVPDVAKEQDKVVTKSRKNLQAVKKTKEQMWNDIFEEFDKVIYIGDEEVDDVPEPVKVAEEKKSLTTEGYDAFEEIKKRVGETTRGKSSIENVFDRLLAESKGPDPIESLRSKVTEMMKERKGDTVENVFERLLKSEKESSVVQEEIVDVVDEIIEVVDEKAEQLRELEDSLEDITREEERLSDAKRGRWRKSARDKRKLRKSAYGVQAAEVPGPEEVGEPVPGVGLDLSEKAMKDIKKKTDEKRREYRKRLMDAEIGLAKGDMHTLPLVGEEKQRGEMLEHLDMMLESADVRWTKALSKFAAGKGTSYAIEEAKKQYERISKDILAVERGDPIAIGDEMVHPSEYKGELGEMMQQKKEKREYFKKIEEQTKSLPADLRRMVESKHISLDTAMRAAGAAADETYAAPPAEAPGVGDVVVDKVGGILSDVSSRVDNSVVNKINEMFATMSPKLTEDINSAAGKLSGMFTGINSIYEDVFTEQKVTLSGVFSTMEDMEEWIDKMKEFGDVGKVTTGMKQFKVQTPEGRETLEYPTATVTMKKTTGEYKKQEEEINAFNERMMESGKAFKVSDQASGKYTKNMFDSFNKIGDSFRSMSWKFTMLSMSSLGMFFSMMSFLTLLRQGANALIGPLSNVEQTIQQVALAAGLGDTSLIQIGEEVPLLDEEGNPLLDEEGNVLTETVSPADMFLDNIDAAIDAWATIQAIIGNIIAALALIGLELMQDPEFLQVLEDAVNGMLDVLASPELMDAVTSLATAFVELLPELVDLIPFIASFFELITVNVPLIGPLLPFLMKLGLLAAVLMPIFAFLSLAANLLGIAFQTVGWIISVLLLPALEIVAAALGITVSAATAVVIVIAAIIAAVIIVVNHFGYLDDVVNFLIRTFQAFLDMLSKVYDILSRVVALFNEIPVIGKATGWLSDRFSGLSSSFSGASDWLEDKKWADRDTGEVAFAKPSSTTNISIEQNITGTDDPRKTADLAAQMIANDISRVV